VWRRWSYGRLDATRIPALRILLWFQVTKFPDPRLRFLWLFLFRIHMASLASLTRLLRHLFCVDCRFVWRHGAKPSENLLPLTGSPFNSVKVLRLFWGEQPPLMPALGWGAVLFFIKKSGEK
jgi:hypothetical protein